MTTIHAMCVAGARPNLMKIKPVMDALVKVGADVSFVHTGQHYDHALSGVFHEDLNLREPDHWLGVGSGTHAEQTGRVMVEFEPIVDAERPDVVVVVGDVNSTLACAIVAAKAGVLLAHVEAGLRSRDWAMPEEVNRVATDRVSDYLFAPSEDAADSLRSEGFRADQIHTVGNVMVDTLMANRERALARPILSTLGVEPNQYGLVTLHRPSNVDDDTTLRSLIATIGELASDLPVVFPMHPRTRARLGELRLPTGVIVTEPCGYLDFLALEAQAQLVLTDSGGVQEETTVLGVPCLTLRESTERPITVTQGTNQVVGRDRNRILSTARTVLRDGHVQRRPELWDGQASQRIADLLLIDVPRRSLRPTSLPEA
jgi:UDP-N-acetylglucosamine 2-epimerase (non-hydrolysing)